MTRVMRAPTRLGTRCQVAALVLLAALQLHPPAQATSAELATAQGLYEEMRYEEAYQAFREALRTRGNEPEDLASIYQHLGILAASMDRADEAAGHFARWLCINPDATLAGGLSPKVQGPYEQARQRVASLPSYHLAHVPISQLPAAGGLALEAELTADGLGLATGLTLRYRPVGAPGFAMLQRQGTGRQLFAVGAAELPAGQDAEYYLQINDDHGGVLGGFGSARAPIRVRAAQAAAVAGAGTPVAASAADAAPFYTAPWFLITAGTGVALAVAGGATALALALGVGQPDAAQFGVVRQEVAR